MNDKVWNKLLSFVGVEERERSGIEEWLQSKQVDSFTWEILAQLQGAFLQLTKYRAGRLALLKEAAQLKNSYFQSNNLHNTWRTIFQMYHCSAEELNDALYLNNYFENMYTFTATDEMKHEFIETYERFLKNIFEEQKQEVKAEIVYKRQENQKEIKVEPVVVKETAATLEVTSPEETSNTEVINTFVEQLNVLQTSSIESVVHADIFTEFQHYMHVERPIQAQFIAALEEADRSVTSSLIMLCGSVGDGKSHLISYAQEKYPTLLNPETCFVHNDSTESYNQSEDELETLERVLSPFENGDLHPKTTVIAINLGVLHNFYMKHQFTKKFDKVIGAIEQSEIFTMQQDYYYEKSLNATLLNFAGVQPYELSATGVDSVFFSEIIGKVVQPIDENPFYRLWKEEWENGERTAAHLNYHLLQDENMSASIVKVLVEAMVKRKLFLSTRALYNLLYDILVPLDNPKIVHPEHLLPYLLFERPDRSDLLHALHELDPIKRRDERFDAQLSAYVLTTDPVALVKEHLSSNEFYFKLWESEDSLDESYLKLYLRHYYLLDHESLNGRYQQFLKVLYHYFVGDGGVIGEFFEYLDQAIARWIGSPVEGYLYIHPLSKNEYSVAVPFKGEQEVAEQFGQAHEEEVLRRFTPELTVGYSIEGMPILIPLDYTLFELIIQVAEGYRPGQQDYNEAIQFMEFYKELIRNSDQMKDLIIVHRETNHMMRIKKPRFARGGKTYEVETVK